MRTVQKTLTGEVIDQVLKPIPVTEIILLPMVYLVKAVNLRRVLFLISFLTYGVGDGITAVYMMERTGIMREVNPLVRFMYATSGAHGVIVMKIWVVFIILFLVWIISKRTEAYWTVNGFLCALIVGGVVAMGANLMALYGVEPPAPGSIVMTFLFLAVLFVMLGDLMDKLGTGIGHRDAIKSPYY